MRNLLFVTLFLLFLLGTVITDLRAARRSPQDNENRTALAISGVTVVLLVLWLAGVKVGMPTRPLIDSVGMTVYQWIKEMLA